MPPPNNGRMGLPRRPLYEAPSSRAPPFHQSHTPYQQLDTSSIPSPDDDAKLQAFPAYHDGLTYHGNDHSPAATRYHLSQSQPQARATRAGFQMPADPGMYSKGSSMGFGNGDNGDEYPPRSRIYAPHRFDRQQAPVLETSEFMDQRDEDLIPDTPIQDYIRDHDQQAPFPETPDSTEAREDPMFAKPARPYVRDPSSPLFMNDDESDEGNNNTSAMSPPVEQNSTNALANGLRTRRRARDLKDHLAEAAKAAVQPRRKRGDVVHDPVNLLIKIFREKKYSWTVIADELTNQSFKCGENKQYTEAAVYGRFVRNAPRIARYNGEKDYDIKDHMHINYGKKRRTQSARQDDDLPAFSEYQDEQLVTIADAVDKQLEEEKWERIALELRAQNIIVTPAQAKRRHAEI